MKQIFILCSMLLGILFMVCGVGVQLATTPLPSVPSSETAAATPTPTVQEVIPPKQDNSATPSPAQEETRLTPIPPENTTEEAPKEDTIRSMQITVGNKTFSATLAENAATRAFIERMQNAPVVINMSDYSGFEKVGSLGASLPTSNSSITANEGDIILYNGNQIVVFYGSNSWSYTKLGKIDDLSGWKEALGDGDVTITFSIK